MHRSYSSVVAYGRDQDLTGRPADSKYTKFPTIWICLHEPEGQQLQDQEGLKKLVAILEQIEAGWVAELQEENRKGRVGRLERQFLRFFDLGQELTRQGCQRLGQVNGLRKDPSTLSKSLAYLENKVVRDHVDSFLEIYYRVALSGADNDVEKICKLRSGLQFFFTVFEGLYNEQSALEKSLESLRDLYDCIRTKFELWFKSEGGRLHGSPPAHMPETHTWWTWLNEEGYLEGSVSALPLFIDKNKND